MEHPFDTYINSQKYLDCQVVTAVNALYYLTGEKIEYNSDYYESLVDMVHARIGGALGIDTLYEALGLESELFNDQDYKSFIFQGKLPVEVNIEHKRYHRHSILIIGYEPRCQAVQVTNFGHETSKDGWMFLEDLDHFVVQLPHLAIHRHIWLAS